jgi:hypothetical protein
MEQEGKRMSNGLAALPQEELVSLVEACFRHNMNERSKMVARLKEAFGESQSPPSEQQFEYDVQFFSAYARIVAGRLAQKEPDQSVSWKNDLYDAYCIAEGDVTAEELEAIKSVIVSACEYTFIALGEFLTPGDGAYDFYQQFGVMVDSVLALSEDWGKSWSEIIELQDAQDELTRRRMTRDGYAESVIQIREFQKELTLSQLKRSLRELRANLVAEEESYDEDLQDLKAFEDDVLARIATADAVSEAFYREEISRIYG